MNGSSTSTKTSISEFSRQVRQEAAKVTWPTRKETMITTGMVFAMSIVAAIFFFAVDQILSLGIRAIFVGFGS